MGRDGRRTSDPLTDPSSSPANAPSYQLIRHVQSNDGAATNGILPVPQQSCNFKGYSRGSVRFIQRTGQGIADTPGGAGPLTITVFEKGPGGFVTAPDITITHPAAGQAFAREIQVDGRDLFFHIAGLAGSESVTVYANASGFDFESS